MTYFIQNFEAVSHFIFYVDMTYFIQYMNRFYEAFYKLGSR